MMRESQRADQSSNHPDPETELSVGLSQDQPINDLLEHAKKTVLQAQSCIIPMTQDNCKLSKSSSSKDPASIA